MNILNTVKKVVAAALLIKAEAGVDTLAKALPCRRSGHRSTKRASWQTAFKGKATHSDIK